VNGARRAWLEYETIHALVYFAAEPAARFAELGLKGWWINPIGLPERAIG